MRFYHVSKDITFEQSQFVPRIPVTVMKGEDTDNPRICISSTVEGCLSSVPWGGIDLCEEMLDDETILVRVYEFEIDENDQYLITPQELWESDSVRDAVYKGEYWYVKDLKPVNSYIIKIVDWQERIGDLLSYEDTCSLDRGEDYETVWDGSTYTLIYNVDCHVVSNFK